MMFSIIIPAYNASNTIERALLSVLKQTYKNFEIIIVDDGSTDNTKNIIFQTLSDKNVIFQYIYQENSGAASARNNAVEHSNGEYIAFLDSDDEWHHEKLNIQYTYIKKLDAKFLSTKYTLKEFDNIKDINIKCYSFKDFLLSNRTSTPCTIIKKDIFIEVNGFNSKQRYSEDYYLWLKVSYKYPLYMITGPALVRLYKYSYGESGLSSHLWEMEKGELSNFKYCYDNKYISIITFIGISVYSLAKFIFRVFHTKVNKYLR